MMKWLLIGISCLFLGSMVMLPLVLVATASMGLGWSGYWAALTTLDTLLALKLSLFAVGVSVVLNGVFGVTAAWYLTRYPIKGKRFWTSIIELPLSISPVIAGMILILTFGSHSLLGTFLAHWDIKVMFTPLAVVMATVFVTLPFMAREVISLMQVQGSEEEEAAYLLGATGWQLFYKVTLPNILPAILVGAVMTVARALGEFGAVAVVSGHIRGLTTTLPLHVEVLYNDYAFSEAFAVSSLLVMISFFALVVRYIVYHWVLNKGR